MKLDYPRFDKKTLRRVNEVLNSGRVNYWTGNECNEFEKEFSKYLGNKYSLTLSNGSVALELALRSLELKKGQQIIVSPRSFIISASCTINLGLKPVFSDVDKNGNLSIDGIERVYNRNVAAIIVVHLNGLSCDMDPIVEFVKKKKILLIEDCSQAHGAKYKNKKVGSFGDISTWSFCQDKIISTGGEGGMISTNNKRLWQKVWSLKDHGKNFTKVFYKNHKIGFKWLHDEIGSNYRMTEMQAAIGRVQLKSLDLQIRKRNFIAGLYIRELNNYSEKYGILNKIDHKCQTCPLKNNIKKCIRCLNSFYRLNFFLKKKSINQKKFLRQLNKNKINFNVGACPEIYREKIFKKFKFYPKKRLPNAKLIGETSISIPINPYKKLVKIKSEIKILKKILDKYI